MSNLTGSIFLPFLSIDNAINILLTDGHASLGSIPIIAFSLFIDLLVIAKPDRYTDPLIIE